MDAGVYFAHSCASKLRRRRGNMTEMHFSCDASRDGFYQNAESAAQNLHNELALKALANTPFKRGKHFGSIV